MVFCSTNALLKRVRAYSFFQEKEDELSKEIQKDLLQREAFINIRFVFIVIQ